MQKAQEIIFYDEIPELVYEKLLPILKDSQPLGAEFSQIYFDNAWDLYE